MKFRTGMKVFPVYYSGCSWGSALHNLPLTHNGSYPPTSIPCETLSEVRWAVKYYLENISTFRSGTSPANAVAIMSDDWHKHMSQYTTRWRLREPLRIRWAL